MCQQSSSRFDREVVIAAEEETTDDDRSEIGSLASSSTSVSSSLLQYRLENGRTYHMYKDGKYNLPNDERENDRLDLQHEMFIYTLDDRLGLAPPCVKDAKVGRVLDVGTGTGIWAIDFGELHPEAEVLGMDLSATQPEFMPPNVRFEIDDLEEDWTYSQPFEYIHHRMLNSCINDWKEYLTKCYDNLKPGGYLEVQETEVYPLSDDNTFPKDCDLAKWASLLKSVAEKTGRIWVDVRSLKTLMTEIGFVDVELSYYKWPTNDWPKAERFKNLGTWNLDNISSLLDAMCMAPFTRVLHWTREEVELFLVGVRKDLRNRNYHAYFPIYCIVGRKPEKKQDTPTAT